MGVTVNIPVDHRDRTHTAAYRWACDKFGQPTPDVWYCVMIAIMKNRHEYQFYFENQSHAMIFSLRWK